MTDDQTAVETTASRGVSRRTIMKGAAWTVPALMVATAAPAYAASCSPGKWKAIGRGKMLSGGLFNLNLDTLASVNGTIASAPTQVSETGFVHGPNAEGDPDVHANPLSLTALGAITVTATGLTTTLSTVLGLIASAPDGTGLLNQFGYAQSVGLSKGASGYVDDNGTVRVAPGGNYPQVASLDLKQFLTPLLGSATTGFLANITNLKLQVGALVGRAILEQMCNTVVNPAGYKLHREYLVAYLRLVLTSPLIAAISKAVRDAVGGLTLSVDSNALLAALGQVPVLGAVVSALQLASATPTVQLTLPSNGAINSVLQAGPIGAGGPIVIDLASNPNTVTIDIASLLGSAFPGGSSDLANSLPANSILFVDYKLPTNALANWVASVQNDIINRIAPLIKVNISYSIAGGLTTLTISGSLADLLAGNATVQATLANPIGGGSTTVFNGTLTNAVFQTIGGLLKGQLLAPGGLIDVALTALNGLLASIFDALKNIINLTINAQNFPELNNDPAIAKKNPHTGMIPADPEGPPRWYTGGSQPLLSGRYDVAALAVSAVGGLTGANGIDLYLARGSVGPHVALP